MKVRIGYEEGEPLDTLPPAAVTVNTISQAAQAVAAVSRPSVTSRFLSGAAARRKLVFSSS